jgi:hypothetical protein
MTDQQLSDQPLITSHEVVVAPRENDAVIREALGVIDEALAQMVQRELVSSGEVADLLLDVRSLLAITTQP